MEKITPKNIENILSLTSMQEGMLFHYLKDPRSGLYFEQLNLEISGAIDVDLFEKAWNVVIQSNEMLRTVFRWEKVEKPSQIILKKHECEIRFHDFSNMGSYQKIALTKIKTNDREEGFDLTCVPFRVTLCKLAEDQYEMIISNHHILYDGWSNGIILKEFFNAYHELSHGGGSVKPPVKPSFKEFIKWIQSRDRNKQEQFWRNYLADFETVAELPIKRKKEEEESGAADYVIILEENIKNKLDTFIKNNKVTLASVFYSAWGILLQKYCGSEDVVFGTTVSGRSANLKGIEDMVGLFINTIPLRIHTHPDETVVNVISKIDHVLHEREEFELTPLVDIQSYSSIGSSLLLFDHIMVIENYPLDTNLSLENNLISIKSYSMEETTHYDLTVGILPFKIIEIKFSFKQGLFDRGTIENLAGHFKIIIQKIIEQPETLISQFEIISTEEKNLILNEFNNTAAEYPKDKTIHQLFIEQAEKIPDHVALVGADLRICPSPNDRHVNLTYNKLNEQSNRLAGVLIEKGIQADSIAAIMIERSIEMIIGIFGILKSGGAYLPINPDYPQERVDYMLKDSLAKLLVITSDIEGERVRSWKGKSLFLESIIYNSNHLNGCPRSGLQHSAFSVQNSNHLAYVIYTSGSTGKPKGVMIEHHSLVNRLDWMQKTYPLDNRDIILQKTTFTFDVSVWEIFWWSIGGARLCLLSPGGEKDPESITQAIEKNHITTMHFVPSMLSVFLDYLERERKRGQTKKIATLKQVIASGEALLPAHVERFIHLLTETNGTLLANLYGPTEATIDVSYFNCSPGEREIIPIGKPIDNIKLYILDRSFHLQPICIPGELSISGTGLARGYLNCPELTSIKFLSVPSVVKIYKTGDLSRWLPDGNIEFLGRIDHQVKIRGFRIEIGEIENQLIKHKHIKEAVVLLNEDAIKDKNLTAYIVSTEELIESELRKYLQEKLPDYMIPSYFVRIEKMPLTPNGKLDRKALPKPEMKAGESYIAPRNEIERKLIAIWSEILGRTEESIGIGDNFFHLGGHSLKAINMINKIHKHFGVMVTLQDVFRNSNISSISQIINKSHVKGFNDIEKQEKKEYYELSYAQKRLWYIGKTDPGSLLFNMPGRVTLYEAFNEKTIRMVLEQLIARHESLRTAFKEINKEPVQVIEPVDQVPIIFQVIDISELKGPEQEKQRQELFTAESRHIFNLAQPPLFRIMAITCGWSEYDIVLTMHHIISDGWSLEILKQEFKAMYEAYKNGTKPLIESKELQYVDYAAWQNRLLADEKQMGKAQEFWREQLSRKLPALNLPYDFSCLSLNSNPKESAGYRWVIREGQANRLRSMAGERQASLFMILLAGFNLLHAKISGQKEIVMAIPAAARQHDDLKNIIGLFVNTLILCNHVATNEPFPVFFERFQENMFHILEYQDIPLESICGQLKIKYPEVSVFFNMVNIGTTQQQNLDNFDSYHIEKVQDAKFEIVCYLTEYKNGIEINCHYYKNRFNPNTIEKLMESYLEILARISDNSSRKVGEYFFSGQQKKLKRGNNSRTWR